MSASVSDEGDKPIVGRGDKTTYNVLEAALLDCNVEMLGLHAWILTCLCTNLHTYYHQYRAQNTSGRTLQWFPRAGATATRPENGVEVRKRTLRERSDQGAPHHDF